MKCFLILTLLYFITIREVYGQSYDFNFMKSKYDQFRINEQNDSALYVARELNNYTLNSETDTSIKYVMSLRLIASCFSLLEQADSAIIYANNGLVLLQKQNKKSVKEYTEILNLLGIIYKNIGEYNQAEIYFKEAIIIRDAHPLGLGDASKYRNNLGYLYVSMGMIPEANVILTEALNRYVELYNSDTSKYISTIHSMAKLKYLSADYEQAAIYFSQWFNWSKINLSNKRLIYGLKDCIENSIQGKDIISARKYKSFADSLILYDPVLKTTSEYGGYLFANAEFYYNIKNYDTSKSYYVSTINFHRSRNLTKKREYYDSYLGLSRIFMVKEMFDSASFYSNKALSSVKKSLGVNHPDYADICIQEAKILSSFGKFNEAIIYLLNAKEIYESRLGLDVRIIAEINRDIGINYRKSGLYKDSYSHTIKALDYYKKNNDKIGYSLLLNNLGYLLIDYDSIQSAITYISQALDIRVELYKQDTLKYHSILHSLAKAYNAAGEYNIAKRYYDLWWKFIEDRGNLTATKASGLLDMSQNFIRLSEFTDAEACLLIADSLVMNSSNLENSLTHALIQKHFGDLFLEKTKFAKALDFYQISEELLAELKLKDSKEFSELMLGMSRYYLRDIGMDLEKSLKYVYEAALIQSKILGIQHIDYAKTLDVMGLIYKSLGNYDSSLICYNKSLSIKLNSVGKFHSSYSTTLNNIGVLYASVGSLDKVLPYYEESLKIKLTVYKGPHKDIATNYSNLANTHLKLGNFEIAEEYFNQALNMRLKVLDTTSTIVAASYMNLAILYSKLGNYKVSNDYYKMASNIWNKLKENQNESYASFLLNYSKFHIEEKQFDLALYDINKALVILENVNGIGNQHTRYSNALLSLGSVYMMKLELDSAEYIFEKALKITQTRKKKNPKEIASCYKKIGDLNSVKQNYALAESFYIQALYALDSLTTSNPSELIPIKIELLKALCGQQKFEEFILLAEDLMLYKTNELTENFEWLNEYQREVYWQKESDFFEYLCQVAFNNGQKFPQLNDLSYNALLISKGQLLESKIAQEGYFLEIEHLRDEISLRRKLITKSESDGTLESKELSKLKKEADSLDRLLIKIQPGYEQQRKNLTLNWEDIQHNLGLDEAAIEFFKVYNPQDSLFYYSAFIIRRGDNHPNIVKLTSEVKIVESNHNKNYGELYNLIWNPLSKYLSNIKVVYYSPVGELTTIPFIALNSNSTPTRKSITNEKSSRGVRSYEQNILNEDSHFLIDDLSLHQLMSTRYLAMNLKDKSSIPIQKSIAVFGGINYDRISSMSSKNEFTSSKLNAKRGSQLANQKLDYLDGTKTESEFICDSLNLYNWKTELFAGTDASEENLIRLESRHAKGVLHIATHGYAFPQINFSDSAHLNNSFRYSYRYSTNPMVRSGLILAGGNWAWTGNDTLSKLGAEQNGILTALEVSQLNLKKTKLVVLSACETGLGKIEGSEGTFGLKRGFKLAGVEQIVVSLWSVPDKETMELMTLFYTDLAQTLNPVISFEKAQKEMRNRYPTEPDKWAGFVLVR